MKGNLNIKLDENDIFSMLKYNKEDRENTLLKENVNKAINELNRALNVSFVYNVEVDLLDFQFKYYQPAFMLKQLSIAALSLGEEVETTLNLYKKKGEETICTIMESGVEILINRLLDYVNYCICNENYEEFQQGPRKLTRDNLLLKKEEKEILKYLNASKIGIKNEDDELFPKFSRVFIVEWAARKNKTPELQERCKKCNAINCKLRIEK